MDLLCICAQVVATFATTPIPEITDRTSNDIYYFKWKQGAQQLLKEGLVGKKRQLVLY